jgi:hypothetical protein
MPRENSSLLNSTSSTATTNPAMRPPAANACCGIGRRVRAGMRLAFTAAISVSQSATPGFARVME